MSIEWLCVLAIGFVLTAILVFRLHAFLSLLTAAFLVAVLTSSSSLQQFAEARLADGKMDAIAAEAFVAQSAVSRVTTAFGATVGSIGIVIALASVIGALLLHSGAAAKIVDAMLRLTGPNRAPEALAAGSFVLGIPVFFDTVFYLMIPLARSLRRKVGKNYVLFILAILAGGSITHSLIPPTPGPLQVAAILNVDVGVVLIAGLVIGSVTSVVSLLAARVINSLVDLPFREQDGEPVPQRDVAPEEHRNVSDASNGSSIPIVGESESELPLLLALAPILMPVVLISAASVIRSLGKSMLDPAEVGTFAGLNRVIIAAGDKNIALGLGLLVAMFLLSWIPKSKRGPIISAAIASAGGIILITAAGGALGKSLYQAGIAEAVGAIAKGFPGLMLLPLAFGVTAAIRTIQGSATIAMITSASILQGLVVSGTLPFHAVYLAMAIGAGSKPVSWMTDSAFWVISEMSGMTEREALRIISPMSIAMGVSALIVTMIAATIFPGI